MRGRLLPAFAVCVCIAALSARGRVDGAAAPGEQGTIAGHVRWTGKLPGNTVIRMGVDPLCAKINAGTTVVQESAVASRDGGLANVFVKVQGSFPQAPAPTDSVTIDQKGCVYRPRVVGALVGQTLRIMNSDPLLHNIHSLSDKSNAFNVGQPMAGMVYEVRLEDEEMLRVKCDIHRWMTAYVGVVGHPYFAVTGDGGTFTIRDVPAGTYTMHAWHELYGTLEQPVRVEPGATTALDFTYPASP